MCSVVCPVRPIAEGFGEFLHNCHRHCRRTPGVAEGVCQRFYYSSITLKDRNPVHCRCRRCKTCLPSTCFEGDMESKKIWMEVRSLRRNTSRQKRKNQRRGAKSQAMESIKHYWISCFLTQGELEASPAFITSIHDVKLLWLIPSPSSPLANDRLGVVHTYVRS